MADAFKLLINPETVAHTARHLRRAWRGFDADRFSAIALDGQDGLEFKARAHRLADALQATLPADFDRACGVLEAALAPPLALDAHGEPVGLQGAQPQGVSGWALWGAGEWVARAGLGEPERALLCLREITQRFTAEFAIRPFIAQRPEAVFPLLERWTGDGSAHVRRLVSEDLNDIAKDHPALVADWVREHRVGASAAREALLRHASRGLIKAGHAPTLAAWGLAHGLKGEATLKLTPAKVAVGGILRLEATLRSRARTAQTLVIDYAVHHVKANGSASPKVFKGWKLELAPGETRALGKAHSLREVTTRRLYPGRHRVELLVNGVAVAETAFDLLA